MNHLVPATALCAERRPINFLTGAVESGEVEGPFRCLNFALTAISRKRSW